MYRVLIVEDTSALREQLSRLFARDSSMVVAGTAGPGDALSSTLRLRPAVIALGARLSGPSGPEVARMIMENSPVPIVAMVEEGEGLDHELGFQALSAGAIAVAVKPSSFDEPNSVGRDLLKTIKLMSEIKVVRRSPARAVPLVSVDAGISASQLRLAVIGASTGGPAVLGRIFASLPSSLPFPVLVVQHISSGFLDAMLQWLGKTTALKLSIAEDGEKAQAGRVYFAPDGYQMEVGAGPRIHLLEGQTQNGFCPSADYLFRSAAHAYGAGVLGVLLTGMGADGVKGLKVLKDAGGVTVAQDEASSVVFGMPGEAVRQGAAMHVLSPEAIAVLLGGTP